MKKTIMAMTIMAIAGAGAMAQQGIPSASEDGFFSQANTGFAAIGKQSQSFKAAAIAQENKDIVNEMVQDAADGNLPGLIAALAQGADINAKSDYGPAALSAAASNNRVEIVRYLLNHGANPNVTVNHASPGYFGQASGVTPLMLVASDRLFDVRIASDLIASGASVNASDSLGDTALMYAAQGGGTLSPDGGSHLDLVKLLLANHADVNAQDKPGLTALMWVAASAGSNNAMMNTPAFIAQRLAIAQELIASGADVNKANVNGANAFDLAKGWACVASPMTKLLAAHGAKAGGRFCQN